MKHQTLAICYFCVTGWWEQPAGWLMERQSVQSRINQRVLIHCRWQPPACLWDPAWKIPIGIYTLHWPLTTIKANRACHLNQLLYTDKQNGAWLGCVCTMRIASRAYSNAVTSWCTLTVSRQRYICWVLIWKHRGLNSQMMTHVPMVAFCNPMRVGRLFKGAGRVEGEREVTTCFILLWSAI